ncbi:hypothetical protein K505DRAFT_148507 [Melanomma pulvis-pyrius CBS 109.77]|uniref:Uncharacterized protein n=1 Tax=Melanomma pulvis-pyrius CBS 109.77 TaxID=1314802 RepID=A0A6A6XKZ0_9PLEO|nr:hypothetical protein K505DRAFT_148507 [Melanomma pulvis-pyrius CBS 109.77]
MISLSICGVILLPIFSPLFPYLVRVWMTYFHSALTNGSIKLSLFNLSPHHLNPHTVLANYTIPPPNGIPLPAQPLRKVGRGSADGHAQHRPHTQSIQVTRTDCCHQQCAATSSTAPPPSNTPPLPAPPLRAAPPLRLLLHLHLDLHTSASPPRHRHPNPDQRLNPRIHGDPMPQPKHRPPPQRAQTAGLRHPPGPLDLRIRAGHPVHGGLGRAVRRAGRERVRVGAVAWGARRRGGLGVWRARHGDVLCGAGGRGQVEAGEGYEGWGCAT